MPPARLALVLPATLALACSWFVGPGSSAVPPAQEPSPAVFVPTSPLPAAPAPPAEVPPAPEAVSIAALQATLGETADGPAVQALTGRLGAPVVRPHDADVFHRYAAHGVVLRFASDGRVAEVLLYGAGEGHAAYRGILPGGLHFGASEYAAARSLGAEIPLREYGMRDGTRLLRPAIQGGRTFRAHGLRLRFDRRGALALVSMLPIAAPGSVHLDDAFAYPGEESGVHGLRVYYQLSVGATPTCEAVDVVVHLTDSAGAPVRARPLTRRARPTVFTAVDEDVRCINDDRDIFIPLADLDLPVGDREVTIDLAARPANERAARTTTDLAAAARTTTSFAMPAVALVRLRVARAEIQREVFSRRNTAAALSFGLSALAARPKLHPDPFWVLVAGRHHHRSKVRPNTFSPRWTEATAWFPLAEGDTLTLHFADEDMADNERLATFRVGLDQLRAAVRDHAPLAADRVERLELDGSEIREADEPSPRAPQ